MNKTLRVQDHSIPSLGFGTFRLKGDSCFDGVETALKTGYRHIDTAQIYDNEEEVGRAIEKSDVQRNDIWLTTKVWFRTASPKEVRETTIASLKKLRTDHVDLLLIHWPNDDVPMEETLGEMTRLRDEGLTRTIGVSNYTSAHLKRALKCAPILCNQVEFHARLDQRLLLGLCQKNDLMLTAYSPLAQAALLNDSEFLQIAKELDMNPAPLALAWLIRKNNVSAIPRSSSAKNIQANFRAQSLSLDDEMSSRIDALMGNGRVCTPDFSPKWDVV